MAFSLCSTKFVGFFFLISAIPFAYIIYQEFGKPATNVYHYHSTNYVCETAKWDEVGHRFFVSFLDGGVGQILVPEDYSPGTVLEESKVINEIDVSGNSSMGIIIDRPRNRLVVAFTDTFRFKYSAIAAYDLSTWNRLFLTQLSGPSDENSFADDVALDEEGNAYITDVIGNKLWKVGVNGKFLSIIRSPLFNAKQWHRNLLGLNGIIYHPDGFLITIHSFTGNLFRVDVSKGDEVNIKTIKVNGGSLFLGDGLLLLSPNKLVVVGNPSTKLLESHDGWETASIVSKFKTRTHRLATAATLKDDKVYLSHTLGLGFPKKHVLVEAVFQ